MGVAALVGGVLGPEVVIGALIGFVGYNEAAKYEKQHGEGPFGGPPLVCGIACGALGLIGSLTTSTFVLWAVVGFVGYNGAARFEQQFGKALARVPAVVWGVACFFFGLVGALVTSALVWGTVCTFLGLSGALVLLIAERGALIAEKNALVEERNALIAERDPRRQAATPTVSRAPADPVVPAPRPQQPPAPPADRWAAAVSRSSGPQPAVPRRGGGRGRGLLPGRR